MLQVVDKKYVKDSLDRYYSVLSKMGYVRRNGVRKLQILVFFNSFVEKFHDELSGWDYVKMNTVLENLYGKGCCLMPYKREE